VVYIKLIEFIVICVQSCSLVDPKWRDYNTICNTEKKKAQTSSNCYYYLFGTYLSNSYGFECHTFPYYVWYIILIMKNYITYYCFYVVWKIMAIVFLHIIYGHMLM